MKPSKAGEKHYRFLDKEQRHRKMQWRMSINLGCSIWDAQELISPCTYDLFACFGAAVSLGTGRAPAAGSCCQTREAAQNTSQGTRQETGARRRWQDTCNVFLARIHLSARGILKQDAEGEEWCDFVGAFLPFVCSVSIQAPVQRLQPVMVIITPITNGVQRAVQVSCSLVKRGENSPTRPHTHTWTAACTGNTNEDLYQGRQCGHSQALSGWVHVGLTSLLGFLQIIICQLPAHKWETWKWLQKLSLVWVPGVFI